MSFNYNTIQFANYICQNSSDLLVFNDNSNLVIKLSTLDFFYQELNLFFNSMIQSKRFVLDPFYQEPITPLLLKQINIEFKNSIDKLITSHQLVSYLDNMLQGR